MASPHRGLLVVGLLLLAAAVQHNAAEESNVPDPKNPYGARFKEPEICKEDDYLPDIGKDGLRPIPSYVPESEAANSKKDEDHEKADTPIVLGDAYHRVIIRFKKKEDPVLQYIGGQASRERGESARQHATAGSWRDGQETSEEGTPAGLKERKAWIAQRAFDGWIEQGVLIPIFERYPSFAFMIKLTLRWYYGAHTRILILDMESTQNMLAAVKVLDLKENADKLEFYTNDQQLATAVSSKKRKSDPYLEREWGLNAARVLGTKKRMGAWNYTKGSKEIVVAVIDTGVDYTHPDLKDSMWVNPGEKPGNGIDDDGNGYMDDVYGINTVEGANHDVTGNPMDDEGHGTHCAGIIAAQAGNEKGASGIAPGVSLMAIKAGSGGENGGFSYSAVVMAFEYALLMKAHIISYSVAGYADPSVFSANRELDLTILKALEDAGVLLVAGASNERWDNDQKNWTATPASLESDIIISVASHTPGGCISGFSNYGDKTVHLAAPGSNILSTVPTWRHELPYMFKSGTSMATPYVSGAAALILSYWKENKEEYEGRAVDVKNILLKTVRKDDRLKDFIITGGYLNAAAALKLAARKGSGSAQGEEQQQETAKQGQGERGVYQTQDHTSQQWPQGSAADRDRLRGDSWRYQDGGWRAQSDSRGYQDDGWRAQGNSRGYHDDGWRAQGDYNRGYQDDGWRAREDSRGYQDDGWRARGDTWRRADLPYGG